MQNFSDGKIPVKDNNASTLMELAKKELSNIYGSEELENISYWLIEHFAGLTRSQLLQNREIKVNQSSIIHFCNAIEKLKTGVPVQYVIGEVDFYGLKLEVSPSVLIPRPETEELVDMIVKEQKDKPGLNILDIGSGSGCIALSLASSLINAKVTAIDISINALEIIRTNAKKNKIINVELVEADILEEDHFMEKKFDMIVSNPPYIAASESKMMAPNVLEHEPSIALFVPDEDPFIFYKRIAELATRSLKRGGVVYVEINERLGNETLGVFNPEVFSSTHLLKDMFGKNRFIKAVRS